MSFDDLYERFNVGYYHNLGTLEEDIKAMFERCREQRCTNELARIYLDQVLNSVLNQLKKKSDFTQKWLVFFEEKFLLNRRNYPHVMSWYKHGGPRRQYNDIEDYKIVTQNYE